MKSKTTPLQKALNLWAVILIVWCIYRTYFKMPEWFDEFIAKPLVFVLPVVYYIKKVDKKNVLSSLYISLKPKKLFQDFLYAVGIGVIFFVTASLAYFAKSGKFLSFNHNISSVNIFLIIITALATGITEEILSRGFVLKKLYEESKNPISSIFFSSILFFFLHVPILFTNAKIGGNLLLVFLATDLLLSMINGLIFIERKSLVIPIILHAFYNIIIALSFI